ncbi:hypothetical protein EDD21DRAFT_310411 [Dissophora ornata]|nr:hypothetical protein EDD21DRAFT_310411 [Dissophora ornata]
MPPKKAATTGSKPNKKQKLSDRSSSAVDSGDKILSKEEEEEMSSALIAQLLAQEGGDDQHGYYAEYNNDANYSSLGDRDYSDDDDDYRNDYNYRPKSKSRRGEATVSTATKADDTATVVTTAEPVVAVVVQNGSEDQNTKKMEVHVATRDPNSIRSHAQKHFIKLFRDNIPLPARVLESGPGYTLSGNDLDPYSSAARPYLAQRLLEDPSLLPAQGGTVFTPQSGAMAKAEKALAKEKKTSATSESGTKESSTKASTRADSPPAEAAYTGRTDYSKARLRNVRERSSINFRQMASDLDPLTMVKCEPFCGQPNSGVLGCQPFGIKVQSNVLLGMDFHAHLMTAEIIGFLAGEWCAATRTIHIKAIFPCRSLPTGQNHVNVEMDPTSEFEVRQEIEKRNMRIVGWYHSHPTFTPDPSLVDIENQTSYQSLFKDESMNEEPFVGAIVGPYDELLPGLSSVINWFYISQAPQERGHPKRLLYDLIEDAELPDEEAASWTKLFDEYRESPERTNFKEQWRQEESETKLQKMLVSLGRRMPWLRQNLLKGKEDENADNAGNSSTDYTGGDITSDATEMIAVEKEEEEQVSVQTENVPVVQACEGSGAEEIEPASSEEAATAKDATAMEGIEPSGQDSFEGTMTSDVSHDHSLVRSLSNESSGSNGSKLYVGLGSLINDPFLIRVEQELTTWEPVAG